jgi:hypothetical protein
MIVINVDIMICIMCDVLLLKCAPSVVLMFKYVLYNNHLCEQKLLPLLKITYYIGVQVDLRIIVKRRWNNHIPE